MIAATSCSAANEATGRGWVDLQRGVLEEFAERAGEHNRYAHVIGELELVDRTCRHEPMFDIENLETLAAEAKRLLAMRASRMAEDRRVASSRSAIRRRSIELQRGYQRNWLSRNADYHRSYQASYAAKRPPARQRAAAKYREKRRERAIAIMTQRLEATVRHCAECGARLVLSPRVINTKRFCGNKCLMRNARKAA